MKKESVHFSSQKQHVSNACNGVLLLSSLWYVVPPAIPQNLHKQYMQRQSPEGNFCHKKKNKRLLMVSSYNLNKLAERSKSSLSKLVKAPFEEATSSPFTKWCLLWAYWTGDQIWLPPVMEKLLIFAELIGVNHPFLLFIKWHSVSSSYCPWVL